MVSYSKGAIGSDTPAVVEWGTAIPPDREVPHSLTVAGPCDTALRQLYPDNTLVAHHHNLRFGRRTFPRTSPMTK
jgi:hypothetical protein